MIFNKHGALAGSHAFLSPSGYHWVNYDDDKLERVFYANQAAQLGVKKHAYAQQAIELGIMQADDNSTLSLYINDSIGYNMSPEQILFYSVHCFGQADAIGFRNNKLRIHDLKTGINEASFTQLLIYAALFCLEYDYRPFNIDMDLRIYQNKEVSVLDNPDRDEIFHIMDKITTFSGMIDGWRKEGA